MSMFQKNKLLTLLLMSLLITACNDNDSDSHGNNNEQKPKVFEQWSNFHFAELDNGYDGEDNSIWVTILTTERSTLTIDNDDLFEKKDYFKSNVNEKKLTPSYATKTGFYGSNEKHSQYGDHLGKINTGTTNQWIVSPNLINGTGKYTQTTHYKMLDIAGQNVLDTLDPDLSVRFNGIQAFDPVYGAEATKFYKKLNNSIFPAGSKCIQVMSIEQNSDVLTLTKFPEPNVKPFDQDTIKASWEYEKLHGTKPLIYKDTEAYLIDYVDSGIGDYNVSGDAKVNSVYYRARHSLKGETFSFAKFVKKNKDEMDANADKEYSQKYEELTKKSCRYFNVEATKFVNELASL